MNTDQITIDGSTAAIHFSRFDLANYELFLKCKKLPENTVTYDWESDTYTVTTPARYAPLLGIDLPAASRGTIDLASHLFDYQHFIDTQALASKRYAVYADCGLGKTAVFLEWARQVVHLTGGRVLIFSPLQVIQQTCEEATRFYGDSLQLEKIDSREALEAWLKETGPAVGITNYEKMIPGQLPELRLLAGLICDESSLLKTGGGKIKWNLIKSAKGIEYKLSCTATPAPNDIMEYASQAAFLEKLRTEGEILWTFFSKKNKGRDKGKWVIKPHAREGFYRFLAGWSIYVRNPKVYGWKDNLSQIPAPVFHEHEIEPTPEQIEAMNQVYFDAGAGLLGTQNIGVTQRIKLSQIAKGFLYEGKGKNRTVRAIPSLKPDKVADIAAADWRAGRQVLIWTVFDEEGRLIEEKLGDRGIGAVILDGSVKQRLRLEYLEAFRRGEIEILISKANLLGFGMNFQCCTSNIVSGFDDSYERFYQLVRRSVRYGQTKTVHVHIPLIRHLEGLIFDNILRKKVNFEQDADEQERFYLEALKGLVAA